MLFVYGLHIQSEMLANPPIATGQVMKNRSFLPTFELFGLRRGKMKMNNVYFSFISLLQMRHLLLNNYKHILQDL